jgi:uncharacterized protein with GYD domain
VCGRLRRTDGRPATARLETPEAGERELAYRFAMREGRSLAKTLSQVVARMPLYLSRFSYATEAKKALLSQPQDRSGAAREMAESLGGKLLGFWYAFGEFDGVFLMEAPDNAAAAAVGMAVGASGALSDIETTVLLDMDEAQDAMRKAAAATYKPPGS